MKINLFYTSIISIIILLSMILFISKNNENDINYLIDKYIQTDSIPLKRKLYSKIKNHGIENIDENFNSSNSLRIKKLQY